MQTKWIDRPIDYTGCELKSRWIFDQCGLQNDAILCFVGGANVPIEHMVDLEDVAANKPIYSEKMLHFIVEHFDLDLERMVLRQRLFIAILKDELQKNPQCNAILRSGNDLYDGKAKLSVSVATSSPVSCLIHTGINISSKNTPVLTKGLHDYDIDPKTLALSLMEKYAAEITGTKHACTKVRSVN
ncbi:MAG: DUF366 family protein [Deltaproteobacteria bacterium]|nr:DUF366 family protein [Deltaproteobacteria bacterium]